MITVDIKQIVDQKKHDLLTRPDADAWNACAAVWARLFILAGPGWRKWPQYLGPVREALSLALLRCVESDNVPSPGPLVQTLTDFDIEFDGSVEWRYVLDTLVVLTPVLEGKDVAACLQEALRSYLQGAKNILTNKYAAAAGHSISLPSAREQLAADPEWDRAVGFVMGL